MFNDFELALLITCAVLFGFVCLFIWISEKGKENYEALSVQYDMHIHRYSKLNKEYEEYRGKVTKLAWESEVKQIKLTISERMKITSLL